MDYCSHHFLQCIFLVGLNLATAFDLFALCLLLMAKEKAKRERTSGKWWTPVIGRPMLVHSNNAATRVERSAKSMTPDAPWSGMPAQSEKASVCVAFGEQSPAPARCIGGAGSPSDRVLLTPVNKWAHVIRLLLFRSSARAPSLAPRERSTCQQVGSPTDWPLTPAHSWTNEISPMTNPGMRGSLSRRLSPGPVPIRQGRQNGPVSGPRWRVLTLISPDSEQRSPGRGTCLSDPLWHCCFLSCLFWPHGECCIPKSAPCHTRTFAAFVVCFLLTY